MTGKKGGKDEVRKDKQWKGKGKRRRTEKRRGRRFTFSHQILPILVQHVTTAWQKKIKIAMNNGVLCLCIAAINKMFG